MIEEKKCVGTGKARGYGCKEPVPVVLYGKANRVYGLGKSCGCYKDWLINSDEGQKIIAKASLRGKKIVEKKEKKKSREEHSLSLDWSKKLQEEINSIVRTIDKGLTCLARNIRGQIHAGHVYARGGNQTIRYNLHNLHRQSAHSNKYQNDDGKLREGLINEYGAEYMEFIGGLRKTPALTFNNKEYRDLTNKARIILKHLKEKDRIYTKSERIELRNRVNIEMCIYDMEFCEFIN